MCNLKINSNIIFETINLNIFLIFLKNNLSLIFKNQNEISNILLFSLLNQHFFLFLFEKKFQQILILITIENQFFTIFFRAVQTQKKSTLFFISFSIIINRDNKWRERLKTAWIVIQKNFLYHSPFSSPIQ